MLWYSPTRSDLNGAQNATRWDKEFGVHTLLCSNTYQQVLPALSQFALQQRIGQIQDSVTWIASCLSSGFPFPLVFRWTSDHQWVIANAAPSKCFHCFPVSSDPPAISLPSTCIQLLCLFPINPSLANLTSLYPILPSWMSTTGEGLAFNTIVLAPINLEKWPVK